MFSTDKTFILRLSEHFEFVVDNLDVEFRILDNFTVEFEAAVVERFYRDFLCGVFAAPIRPDVFAFEKLEKTENDFALFISLT